MNILITGISGFIGQALCRHLHKSNYVIHGLDLVKDPVVDSLVDKYFICNLLEVNNVDENCKNVDVIVHLAGASAVDDASVEHEKNNLTASKKLIDCAVQNKVKKIIFLSTIKVDKEDSYAVSKLSAESYLIDKTKNSQSSYCILRSALVYGVGMKNNINRWLLMIKNNFLFAIPESDSEIVMVGLDDLCGCIVECIQNSVTDNKTYTLSDGINYKINEIEAEARKQLLINPDALTCPRWIIYLGALCGEGLSKIGFSLKINKRLYNMLFFNKVHHDTQFVDDTAYIFKQNFISEISNIFTESDNKQ